MGKMGSATELLSVIKQEMERYYDYVSDASIEYGNMLCGMKDDLQENEKLVICNELLNMLSYECPHPVVWWLSVALELSKNKIVFRTLVEYILENQARFSANTLYFLFYQLKGIDFRNLDISDMEAKTALWKLFLKTVERFEERMTTSLERIPMEKRNPNLLLVITEQVLDIQHGPTKTACDRCKTIKTELGKEVLLINTAEILSGIGRIPFAGACAGNYASAFLNDEEKEWKGVKIPYLQCNNDMPNFEAVDWLLAQIRNMAPERIVLIGGASMVGNLANKMIPAVSIGLCPSAFEWTSVNYKTLGRKLSLEDEELLNSVGVSKDNVIECVFTSGLKTQEEYITRADLGFAEDDFVIVVVGSRLDVEVTDEFLGMLEPIVNEKIKVGFLGYFDTYEEKVSHFPRMKSFSKYLGYCSDILSRMEVCDLYVNPTRRGGGTSAVEALFKGVPVVADGFGDVATNVGEDFIVKDYDGMKAEILRYFNDKEYYAEKSSMARKRSEVLLDTDGEFLRILAEVEKREKNSIHP